MQTVSEIIEDVSPYYRKIKANLKAQNGPAGPESVYWDRESVSPEEHVLTYDSTSETLEPVYFWLLDFMNGMYGGKVDKLVDNFASSPGSGHFSELGMKLTRMQEEGMKIMGAVNTVLKSIINLIYDLKEFEIRISHYDTANSPVKEEAESGLLALKQMWMDNVDVKRGRGSINMLAQDLNFVTLRDAFMIAGTVNEVDKMDLNERVKRILKPRLKEFFEWRKRSEIELRKRFQVEKSYLKSQVNSLQLYTRWAKPYLLAAEKLRMQEKQRDPSLVNIFNTIVLELTLFAKEKVNVNQKVVEKDLPREFLNRKFKRDYYACLLVDFVFRGIPQRISGQQSHYVFGGRTDVTFRAYCLNDDELKLFEEKLKKSDINDALTMVDLTTESLDAIKEDLDYFLKSDKEKELEIKEKKKALDVNPFTALFGSYKKKKDEREKEKAAVHLEMLKKKGVSGDNYAEKILRSVGETDAGGNCYTLFDTYKKAHGMASLPKPYEDEPIPPDQ